MHSQSRASEKYKCAQAAPTLRRRVCDSDILHFRFGMVPVREWVSDGATEHGGQIRTGIRRRSCDVVDVLSLSPHSQAFALDHPQPSPIPTPCDMARPGPRTHSHLSYPPRTNMQLDIGHTLYPVTRKRLCACQRRRGLSTSVVVGS